MKKLIAMLLVLAMMLACTACGGNENNNDNPGKENQGNVSGEKEEVGAKDPEQEKEDGKLPFTGEITEEMLRSYPETPVEDFEYSVSLNYDGIEITAYNGSDNIVVVPATIDGRPVVEVEALTFGTDSTVRAVVLPDTVKEISGVFTNNKCLEFVIAEGAEIIGMSAFQNCSVLKDVALGDTITEIRMCAFASCTALEKLVIPATLTEIANDAAFTAFGACPNLTIYGESGSYIETFANEHNIPFVAE